MPLSVLGRSQLALPDTRCSAVDYLAAMYTINMVRHTKKDAYGAHTSVSRFEQLRCQGLGLLYAVCCTVIVPCSHLAQGLVFAVVCRFVEYVTSYFWQVDTCGLHEQNLGPLRRKAYTIVVGHKGLTTPSHRGAAARLSA